MKMSDLTPEVAEFAKRLKISYSGGGHGATWASRTYRITLDDGDEVVAYQLVNTTRKGYGHEWRKGKVTYSLPENVHKPKEDFKDLASFLQKLMERNSMKIVRE